MTYSSEKLIAFLADKLAFVEISYAPETRDKDYGYSVNLYFPEREYWSFLKAVDTLSVLSEEGKKLRKDSRAVRDETRREIRDSILRRKRSESAKRSRKGKGRRK